MINDTIRGLMLHKKNFVFIGEAGSGKTEAAMNFALCMAEEADRPVHFFDMDQTKPLFRARDAAGSLKKAGVVFHNREQLLDAPVVPSAVIESLGDGERYVVMDVGGNELGAHMIGQFSGSINNEDTYVFFIVNPYRPWSRSAESIRGTIDIVTGCSRIENVHLISNPNLGPDTTADEVIEGNERLHELLGVEPDFTCVLEELIPEVRDKISGSILPMHIFILYPWQEKYDI